jgi:hypothetical protein
MTTTLDDNKQEIEQKIGEALGLEMAAQKAVADLGTTYWAETYNSV